MQVDKIEGCFSLANENININLERELKLTGAFQNKNKSVFVINFNQYFDMNVLKESLYVNFMADNLGDVIQLNQKKIVTAQNNYPLDMINYLKRQSSNELKIYFFKRTSEYYVETPKYLIFMKKGGDISRTISTNYYFYLPKEIVQHGSGTLLHKLFLARR